MPLLYDQLDPSRVEIRLLTILPGQVEDEICLSLHKAALDDGPNFEALSYVWGDPTTITPIIISDTQAEVTVNLAAALRYLRHAAKPRIMWVDALCINQVDITEKAVQVPLMGRIYRSASSTIAWLGEPTADFELAVSWFKTYIEKRTTDSSRYWLDLEVAAASRPHEIDLAIATVRVWSGYMDFINNAYWNRMWTFQEFRLPRKEPTCMFGRVSITASSFSSAFRIVMDTVERFTPIIIREFEAPVNGDLGTRGDQLLQLARLLQTLDWKERGKFRSFGDLRRYDPSVGGETFTIFLWETQRRQSSDPRDRIFALYGLYPAIQVLYPPDYAKPLEQVLLETTAYLVNSERSSGVKVFGDFPLREDRFFCTSYPSWVPDLCNQNSIERAVKVPIAELLRVPNGAGSPPSKVDDTLSKLHLQARNLGTITVVLKFGQSRREVLQQISNVVLPKQPEGSLESLGKTADVAHRPGSNLLAAFRMEKSKKIDYPNKVFDAVARASLLFTQSGISNAQLRASIYDLLGHDITEDEIAIKSKSDVGRFRAMWLGELEEIWGMALVITCRGCIGICPGEAQDGDYVTLPPAGGAPMVLRPDKNVQSSSQPHFRMVGPGYFAGVMEDECLDPELVAELAQDIPREYIVY